MHVVEFINEAIGSKILNTNEVLLDQHKIKKNESVAAVILTFTSLVTTEALYESFPVQGVLSLQMGYVLEPYS